METGSHFGDAAEIPHGSRPEEIRNSIRNTMVESARRLLPAYEKNVAPLLKDKGIQHGAPDPLGYIEDAKQTLRVLNTVLKPGIDPYKWPEHFQIPDHIRFVLINEEGDPYAQEVSRRNFDNPTRFVEALESFLMVGLPEL
jgi:hypothetical protein